MPNTFFIGDLHFGHVKVSEIRGYASTVKHDTAIAKAWYKQVREEDEVFVLGDTSSGSSEASERSLKIIANLPGIKHLIAGNHDPVSSIHRNAHKHQRRWLEVFTSIQQYARIRLEGKNVLLSHYPYASQGDGPGRGEARYSQYRLPDEGLHLVHAHTHHNHPTSGGNGRELCVSWDAWNRLAQLGDIAAWLKEEA